MAQTVINDTQGVVTREAGTGTRLENNVVMTGNIGVGADPGVGRAIGSLTLTNAGSGATNGTYYQAALTGGSGTGATADIIVAGNVVTRLILRNPGQGYNVGDTLTTAVVGGTGFIFTVASVTSIFRSDGIAASPRIGAGTTFPRNTMDIRGLTTITDVGTYVARNPYTSFTPLDWKSQLFISGDNTATGTIPIVNEDTVSSMLTVSANLDFSARTTGGTVYGAYVRSMAATPPSAAVTSTMVGIASQAALYGPYSGKTVNLYGVQSFGSVGGDITGTNTITNAILYTGSLSIFTSTVQNVTTFVGYNLSGNSFSSGAHVISNFYAARFQAPSLSGGSTITNRWGMSQEDAAANNVYAGKSALGQAAGTVPTANADIGASTTAAAALRIRSGVAPTAPNDGDIWFDGSAIKVQIGGVTKTVTVT